jgi:hypothetical protein
MRIYIGGLSGCIAGRAGAPCDPSLVPSMLPARFCKWTCTTAGCRLSHLKAYKFSRMLPKGQGDRLACEYCLQQLQKLPARRKTRFIDFVFYHDISGRGGGIQQREKEKSKYDRAKVDLHGAFQQTRSKMFIFLQKTSFKLKKSVTHFQFG